MSALKRLACLSLWSAALLLAARAEEKPDPAGVEFFESKIRPVLADQCYSCHSSKAEKLKGGLRLDTRDDLLKGGETGPAIEPGHPEKSLLIRAIRYTDDNLQMPPKGKKLSPEQVLDFESWIKVGAPDPRSTDLAKPAHDAKKTHWAFQPIVRPSLPKVSDSSWVKNPIDAFVLARLESHQLSPSERADRRTLIRRASFDLTGLPPTPEEVESFLHDDSDRAWENVIDRLLASPQYGERWARHWLDVARYADTKGYVFEEERRFPYSYTYRDYVIRSFNEDLPFDEFIVEQLAADLLPLGEDKRPLAAMGFLTLGRRFLNNQPDIIDDRIDVVSRGLMGLTVGCARCHDHKYDPIPTRDYYSLYGVFASSSEPREKPMLGTAALPKEYPQYEAERKKRQEELDEFRETKFAEVRSELRTKASEYMRVALEAEKLADKGKLDTFAREHKLHPIGVTRWINFLNERRKSTDDPIFAPWFAFAAVTNFAADARPLFDKFRAATNLNPVLAQHFGGQPPASLQDVAELYQKAFAQVDKAWSEARKQDRSANRLPDDPQEAVRQVLYADAGPTQVPDGEIPRLFDVPTGQKNRALQRKLEELDATHPGSPPRGMVLNENSEPFKPHVFVRGNQFNQGPEVPRQFLELIAGPGRKPFEKGSGRLELARAIANRDNPLTSRVLVNRVWLNHFGAGLVRTPSDFGIRAEPPTHPELLDYLASWFMDNGWSLKKLHKLMLLSSTYQQASEDKAECVQKDPSNSLLWRMNRRRLEFEPFRDTLLAVAGKLDLTEGGHPVEIATDSSAPRRTIYGFVERQNLPAIFRTFDFASPDTTSPQRFNTTVPQQALFMINSPFVAQQARSFVRRPEVLAASNSREKIAALYLTALQRMPSAEELSLSEEFIARQSEVPAPEPPIEVWKYGFGEVSSAPLKLASFHALPHFTGKAWQGGDKLPDEKLGWLTISAGGGHPGDGPRNAVVRRWVAPRDCVVSVSGALEHSTDSGDGVRGYVFSSRLGALGFWPVYHAKHEMNIPRIDVKKGDTLDFVVDSNGSLDSDSFNWAPVIQAVSGGEGTWNAREEFSGPRAPIVPLGPWEKLAQVLLMSNELAFVD